MISVSYMIQINREKSVVFLYTNNKFSERKSITLTRASKTKYLGINLTMQIENLYSENYERLIKEIKEEANQCEGTSRSCIREECC